MIHEVVSEIWVFRMESTILEHPVHLHSKNQFLLMPDWKKLFIALHYNNNRTQKLNSRNYAYFANSVLFSKLNNFKT